MEHEAPLPAEAEEFGKLIRDCRYNAWSSTKLLLFAGFGVLLVWGMTLAVWIESRGMATTPLLILAPLATLMTIGGLAYYLSERRYRDMRLLIMTRGLVYVERGNVRTCRWKDIRRVEYMPPIGGANIEAYRLEVAKGKDLVFNSSYFKQEDISKLGSVLKKKIEELSDPPEWTVWEG